MTDPTFVAPPKQGMSTSVSHTVGQVDPMSIRSKLMLETLSHMMTEADWPYRVPTIDLVSQGDEIGEFRLFGANNPTSLRKVFEREIDIAIMNPGAILDMANRGIGLFSEPMQLRGQQGLGAHVPHRHPRQALSAQAECARLARRVHHAAGEQGAAGSRLQL